MSTGVLWQVFPMPLKVSSLDPSGMPGAVYVRAPTKIRALAAGAHWRSVLGQPRVRLAAALYDPARDMSIRAHTNVPASHAPRTWPALPAMFRELPPDGAAGQDDDVEPD
jgi:hypothetical protein